MLATHQVTGRHQDSQHDKADHKLANLSAFTTSIQLDQVDVDRHNEDPKPFVWHKSADTILASVARAAGTII